MIKLAQDTIDKQDIENLSGWLLTMPKLTQGELCALFEEKFAKKMGIDTCTFVNSGSSANLIALYGLIASGYLKKGDSVVIPALCWSTDIAPVVQLGLNPILCDINLRNLAVCPVELEKILSRDKPKVLMLVSVLGMPPDMEEIAYLCKKNDCLLFLDNCESLGSMYDGHLLESYAFCSTMSLYYGHHCSTIEGGAVFTNDFSFYNILKMLRSHGWDRDIDENLKTTLRSLHGVDDFQARYTFYYPGFNLRATEINAFLGLRQIDKMDFFIKKREENFAYYQKHIINSMWKPEIAKENFVSNLGYPVIVKRRDRVEKAFSQADIECRPLISGNIARHPAYINLFKGQLFKNADIVHENGMYLPNNPFLTEKEMFKIIETFNNNQ